MTDELDQLRARVTGLEREHRRAFDDAQREADALFAQYQLSQLIASGGSPAQLGQAVVLELVRLADGEAGAIWLGETGGDTLALIATTGAFHPPLPTLVSGIAAVRALASDGIRVVVLGEEPPATVLALRPRPGRTLDPDGLRVATLARHELAVAFGGARLRETLDRERHELASVVDGATDLIVQVDEGRRIVRLNPAGAQTLGIDAGAAVDRTCDDVLGCEAAGGHAAERCPLAEVIASGMAVYRESAVRGAHGAPIRVAGGYSRAPGPAGGSLRATAILRDITAVEALERAARELRGHREP